MTATDALERRIDELCNENERLRQERREYQATIDSLVDECTDYKAENAKLREQVADACMQLGGAWVRCAELRQLVRDMRTCIDHACMCEFCPLFVSEDMNERRCIADVKAHMRELGVDDGTE